MRLELGRHLRLPGALEIAGRRDRDAANRADAGGDRGALGKRADSNRDIEPLLHQVDRAIDQSQRHRHVVADDEGKLALRPLDGHRLAIDGRSHAIRDLDR